MPQRNSLLSLAGDVIATHEKSKMLTILLYDLFIVQKNRDKASATTTGISNAPAGSLGTPSKRLHQSRKENLLFYHHPKAPLVLPDRSTSSTITVAPTASDSLETIMNEADDIQPE
jgi:hypothetical protein